MDADDIVEKAQKYSEIMIRLKLEEIRLKLEEIRLLGEILPCKHRRVNSYPNLCVEKAIVCTCQTANTEGFTDAERCAFCHWILRPID